MPVADWLRIIRAKYILVTFISGKGSQIAAADKAFACSMSIAGLSFNSFSAELIILFMSL